MKKYPTENWRKFGRLVYQARIRAGFSDTQEWAQKVGRSSRMLLGLERGEPVGSGTLDLIAVALDWAPDAPYVGLENPDDFGAAGTVTRGSVGGADNDDVFELKMRRPDGMSVEEWKRRTEEYREEFEWKIRRAAGER